MFAAPGNNKQAFSRIASRALTVPGGCLLLPCVNRYPCLAQIDIAEAGIAEAGIADIGF
jgi:hypothetical protein